MEFNSPMTNVVAARVYLRNISETPDYTGHFVHVLSHIISSNYFLLAISICLNFQLKDYFSTTGAIVFVTLRC